MSSGKLPPAKYIFFRGNIFLEKYFRRGQGKNVGPVFCCWTKKDHIKTFVSLSLSLSDLVIRQDEVDGPVPGSVQPRRPGPGPVGGLHLR